MITAERQATSRLIALGEESEILGYTPTDNPRRFVRELCGGGSLPPQVRIYEVCPATVEDVGHYYDFDAQCLLRQSRSAQH